MDHLAWLLDSVKNSQPVTMPRFAKEFGFIIENDAHKAFSALISVTDISQEKRKRLQMDYDVWRRNYGKGYWSSKSASSQIKMSIDRAAEQLSQGGEHVIRKNVQGFLQEDKNDISHPPSNHTEAEEVIARKEISSTPPHHACECILKHPSTGP
ncbi:MAG: hypothetical protein J3Q66DRAFT_200235 [Benniella sp.]|nr:MAG: hypothetical protein J3Q66DRAFT_200235 [Benniella sp.]